MHNILYRFSEVDSQFKGVSYTFSETMVMSMVHVCGPLFTNLDEGMNLFLIMVKKVDYFYTKALNLSLKII